MFVTRGMLRSALRPAVVNMKATKVALPLLAAFQNTNTFSPTCFISRSITSSSVRMSEFQMNHQVYIGNLSFDTLEEELTDLVRGKAEGMKSIKFLRDASGKCRGFAYIDFHNQESATEAVKTLGDLELAGRVLKVDYSEPRSKDSPKLGRALAFSVFVGNIDAGVSESLIREMLDEVLGHDTADKIRMAVDRETGRLKGYAHIDFKTEDLAKKAVAELTGIELMGRVLRIDYATSKHDGRGVLTSQGSNSSGSSGRKFTPNECSIFLG